ncbi:hypothetical protein P7H06_25520 [Paenibacillus larvae]|nr:hypothetical protein [Paenibacillus larvae]MDT2262177.1 hypothetical protein [Paenibacillus larvae]
MKLTKNNDLAAKEWMNYEPLPTTHAVGLFLKGAERMAMAVGGAANGGEIRARMLLDMKDFRRKWNVREKK